MIPDDESMIRTEPSPPPKPPTPGLEDELYKLDFRPFGYEW